MSKIWCFIALMLYDFPGTKWGHYSAAEPISVRPRRGSSWDVSSEMTMQVAWLYRFCFFHTSQWSIEWLSRPFVWKQQQESRLHVQLHKALISCSHILITIYYFMVLIKYSMELKPEHHFLPLLTNLALVKLHKQVHNLNIFQHNLWLQGCKFQEQFERK